MLSVVLGSALVSAPAQVVPFSVWCQRTPATHPVRLGHPAMVYDTALGAVLLVSRRRCDPLDPPPCPVPTETWMFDGAAWQDLRPSPAPGLCLENVLAYDLARRRAVLPGPFDVNGQRETQTWEWDGSARTWTQKMGPQPPLRVGHAMAYDGRRIILFGGASAGSLNDTWEWDGTNWRQLMVIGPPARSQHRMAYHRAQDKVVMFGGEGFANPPDRLDTWVWNGSGWTQLIRVTSDPAGRTHHAMTYDAVQDRVLMYGGLGPMNIGFTEVWEWNVSWQPAQPQPCAASLPLPAGRHQQGFAYDERRRCSVMFGGYRPQNWVEDTWEYFLGPPASYVAFGQGCGPCPPTMTPVPGSLPRLGETFRLNITCVPVWAFPFIGVSNTCWLGNPLPLPLGALGLQGCTLYASIDVQQWRLVAVNGTATWNLPIPDITVLIGGKLYLQSLVLDPQANNVGLVLSDAGEATVGLK